MNQRIRDLAHKLGARPVEPFKLDRTRARAIAWEYERLRHKPHSPRVKECYQALIRETVAQYQAIVRELGLVIEAIPEGRDNPYASSQDLFLDVRNGHLWYYPTSQGFGSVESPGNPLLAPCGITLQGKELCANDVFRIVHDIFGHCKEGNGFGPLGEEKAYREHSTMYSDSARQALTTETRGQNSWVNFGPYGDWNQANPGETKYANQKTGLLPEWCGEL